jgi:uncharacterized metal-binding protein YceD (DUF177 family)
MPLIVNLRHLEERDVALNGELPVADLDLDSRDDMIRATRPLQHELEVQLLDDSLLVRGRLRLPLDCQCVRCLRPFRRELELNPWTRHLPLEGDEKVPVVNDCADLTPYVREDILLEFPRHPLCRPDCPGLEETRTGKAKKSGGKNELKPSAWAELDKLKL